MKRIYWIVTVALGVVIYGVLFGCGGGDGGAAPGSTLRINTTRGGVYANAEWVAVQDGDGPWTRLVSSEAGRYSVDLTDPSLRYGIAVVTIQDQEPVVRVLQMTRANGMEWNLSAGEASGADITLQPRGVAATADWRGSMWDVDRSIQGSFPLSLKNVPSGDRDCLAALYTNGFKNPPTKLIVHRNHAVSGPQNIDIDFNSGEAVAPQTFAVEAPGGALGTIINVDLHTSNGAVMRTSQVTTSGRYAVLPSYKRAGGDLYVAWGGEELWPNKVRLASQTFQNPTAKSLTLSEAFGSATVTGDGAVSLRATWTAYPGAGMYEISFERDETRSRALASRDWLIYLSPTWLGRSTGYTSPDLRAVAGWNNAWNLDVQTAIEWTVGAYRASVGADKILGGIDRGVMLPLVDKASSSYSMVIGHYN